MKKEQGELSLAPKTFAELKKWSRWRSTLRLLKRTDQKISVMESIASMGRYCEVILTDTGFQVESGKAGMSAAFSKKEEPSRRPIKTATKVLEMVMDYNEPLDEEDKRPTESEIIATLIAAIDKIDLADKKLRKKK